MRDNRGVSEIVGFLLLFSTVALMVASVAVGTAFIIEDTRDGESIRGAENTFAQLYEEIQSVVNEKPSTFFEIESPVGDYSQLRQTEITITDGTNTTTLETQPIQYRTESGHHAIIESGFLGFSWNTDGNPSFRIDRYQPRLVQHTAAETEEVVWRLPELNHPNRAPTSRSIESTRTVFFTLNKSSINTTAFTSDDTEIQVRTDEPDLWEAYLTRLKTDGALPIVNINRNPLGGPQTEITAEVQNSPDYNNIYVVSPNINVTVAIAN